jgi:hypothetical protein
MDSVAKQLTWHRQQIRQAFGAKARTWCPKCALGRQVTRRLARPAIDFTNHFPAEDPPLDLPCDKRQSAQAAGTAGWPVAATCGKELS